MITREELIIIKGRIGALKPYHQRIRALSENAYRLVAHDLPLLIAALEQLIKEGETKNATSTQRPSLLQAAKPQI